MLTAVQIHWELEHLVRILKAAKVKTVVEIGAYECALSSMLALELGEGALVVAVDLPEEDGGTKKEAEAAAYAQSMGRFHLVRGRSTALRTKQEVFLALQGRGVDFLFIDAEHTEAAMLGDYEMYRPLLSREGITGFHDITMHELWPVWNRLRGMRPLHRSIEIVKDLGQQGCGIGLLLGK